MEWIGCLVAFAACVVGKICGMGGGVIIKPVLDAAGVLNVEAVNFLSGSTVAGMTLWAVGKSLARREPGLDLTVSTPLALGAAAGGLLGKRAFSAVAGLLANAAGSVQAGLLLAATLATLLYTLNQRRFAKRRVRNPAACMLIGLVLGVMGTFLGVGGGPFNVAALYFFFSMRAKAAALNSLYIILVSQMAGLLSAVLTGGVPALPPALLLGMVACGVLGGEAGARLNRRLSEQRVMRLFELSMGLIMVICVYNVFAHIA